MSWQDVKKSGKKYAPILYAKKKLSISFSPERKKKHTQKKITLSRGSCVSFYEILPPPFCCWNFCSWNLVGWGDEASPLKFTPPAIQLAALIKDFWHIATKSCVGRCFVACVACDDPTRSVVPFRLGVCHTIYPWMVQKPFNNGDFGALNF